MMDGIRVVCTKEIGTWTVRLYRDGAGYYIFSHWREAKARRVAMDLIEALGLNSSLSSVG
jgi:hypothetical protein